MVKKPVRKPCLVVLIGKENGKTIRTTFGIYYDDDYVREQPQPGYGVLN